jgi:hypothetical protein
MKQVCNKWYQSLLEFLDKRPSIAKMLFSALSIGFVLVAFGVAVNLANSPSLINFLVKLFSE